jgi:hypothetical protein
MLTEWRVMFSGALYTKRKINIKNYTQFSSLKSKHLRNTGIQDTVHL